MVARCKAMTVNGTSCGAQALRDGWCAWHDPARQAEMAAARRKGGKAKSNQARARKQLLNAAMTPAELEGILGMTITQVLSGAKPPGVGQAVAALARAAVMIRQTSELEARLTDLERSLGMEQKTA